MQFVNFYLPSMRVHFDEKVNVCLGFVFLKMNEYLFFFSKRSIILNPFSHTQFIFLGKPKLTLNLILGNCSGHIFFFHCHITEAHWVGPIFKLAHQFWFSYPPPGAGGSTSKFSFSVSKFQICFDFFVSFLLLLLLFISY